jgi:hypothetical protein
MSIDEFMFCEQVGKIGDISLKEEIERVMFVLSNIDILKGN